MPFNCDFEVFPAKPPRFCDQVLSSSRLWLSFRVSAKINYPDINTLCAPGVFSRNPSHGILAPTAPWCRRASWDEWCPTQHKHLQGLGTLSVFITLQPPRPYFMPEMLMGFPSQSFIPYLKLKLSRVNCSYVVHFSIHRPTREGSNQELRTHTLKLCSSGKTVP
jgi:hypothetical protein